MEKDLFEAIKNSDVNSIKYLLAKHIFGEANIITAISISIPDFDPYLVKEIWNFLNVIVNLEAVDKEGLTHKKGLTPFNWALTLHHPKIIDIFLMIPNLDLTQTGTDGRALFPLFYAAKYTNIPLMQTLLDRNADINQQAYSGLTAFYFAYGTRYQYGKNPLVDFFLNRPEMDVNTTSNFMQSTPLMTAAGNWDVEVVEKLLRRTDIDVFKKNRFGQTALDRARAMADNKIVIALLEAHINSTEMPTFSNNNIPYHTYGIYG
jgi:ankyrin repeat protein